MGAADGYLDLFREEPSQFDAEGFLQEFGPVAVVLPCRLSGDYEHGAAGAASHQPFHPPESRRQNSEIAASCLSEGRDRISWV